MRQKRLPRKIKKALTGSGKQKKINKAVAEVKAARNKTVKCIKEWSDEHCPVCDYVYEREIAHPGGGLTTVTVAGCGMGFFEADI
jgi:7-cyano-7-deazaguanine synthase in queuosine biosynthesis